MHQFQLTSTLEGSKDYKNQLETEFIHCMVRNVFHGGEYFTRHAVYASICRKIRRKRQ